MESGSRKIALMTSSISALNQTSKTYTLDRPEGGHVVDNDFPDCFNLVSLFDEHCYSSQSSSLKVCCLNICSLSTKTHYVDFVNVVHTFDVIGLVETELVDGYCFYGVNRERCIRKSEGIGQLVKKSLASNVVILCNDNENCLMFKMNGMFDRNIIFLCSLHST